MPVASPVIVFDAAVDPVAVVVSHVAPSSDEYVYSYPVIALPPFWVGAVHVQAAVLLLAAVHARLVTVDRLWLASAGTPYGVPVEEAAEATDSPFDEFVQARHVYEACGVSPNT